MEAAAAADVVMNHNHIEENAPAPMIPVSSFDVPTLMKRREKAIAEVNASKAQREYLVEQLKQQEDITMRSEGILIGLNQLIAELDPNALRPQGG